MRVALVCVSLVALSCDGKSHKIDPDKPAGRVLEVGGSPSAARGAAEARPLIVDSDLFVQDRVLLAEGDTLRFQLFHNAAVANWSGPREVELKSSSVWDLAGKPIDRLAARATGQTASAGVNTEREAAETEATAATPESMPIGAETEEEPDPAQAPAGDPGPEGGSRKSGGGGKSGGRTKTGRPEFGKGDLQTNAPPDDELGDIEASSGGGALGTVKIEDGGDREALRKWMSNASRCSSKHEGETVVRMRIEAVVDDSGKVKSLKVSGRQVPEAVRACVVSRLRAAKAPPGKHTVTINLP